MRAIKYIVGTILLLWGIVTLFNGLAGLPEGIVAARQGNYAGSGAASGGLLFGPLIIWGAIALFRSAMRESRELQGPEVSAADRVRNMDDNAE